MAFLKPDRTYTLGGVNVSEYLLTKHNPNKISMPTAKLTNVIGVTIHNTDAIKVASGTTMAEQYTRATVNGNMKSVRVHFYVDANGAWQNLPLDLSGWHAADGSGDGNRKTIAIECIMSKDYTDDDKKAEQNCKQLVAALLKQYGLGIDHLFTHTHWLNVKDGKKGSVDYLNTAKNSYKNCLPVDNTELLTRYGWMSLTDIKAGDEVAAYYPERGTISFANVEDVVEPYEATVARLRDIEATPDHRMYVKPSGGGQFKIERWGDVISGASREVKTSSRIATDGLPLTCDEIALLVWVQGDGHYMIDNKSGRVMGVEFHLKKERKINRVKSLLDSIGIDYSESACRNGSVHIRIYGSALYTFAESWLDDKKFTYKLINMNMEQFDAFLNELLIVDGNNSRQTTYCSADSENLDVVQAICATHERKTATCTLGSSKNYYGDRPVCINISDGSYNIGRQTHERETYRDTTVSCVTVDSGLILIRQNHRTFIVGNCPAYILPHWDKFKAGVSALLTPAAQPAAGGYPVPTRTLKKGMTGDDVRWMQDKLAKAGYLRSTEIDGDFGKISLGALAGFQLENKLDVDGCCGPKSRTALAAVK